MIKILIFVILSQAVLAKEGLWKDSCYKFVANDVCSPSSSRKSSPDSVCNGKSSGFEVSHDSLQNFVTKQIEQSFQFLTMATVQGTYKVNRLGFEKLYRNLSDQSWEGSIDLIKYITKRGHGVDLRSKNESPKNWDGKMNLLAYTDASSELQSLSLALDMSRDAAETVHNIHRFAITAYRSSDIDHDAEVISYLENNYVHKQADTIRTLTGYLNDLHAMSFMNHDSDALLASQIFDEYLLKA